MAFWVCRLLLVGVRVMRGAGLDHNVAGQSSLLADADESDSDPQLDGARRRFLARGAWVEHVPGWVTGGDPLFDELLHTAPWQREKQRPMYDRIVDRKSVV